MNPSLLCGAQTTRGWWLLFLVVGVKRGGDFTKNGVWVLRTMNLTRQNSPKL